jgi:ribokinase
MSARVVVVGSSNTDLVVALGRLPRPGETLLGGEHGVYAGGKGANQAVAAARAGARVVFVGARGEDDFGRAAARGLAAEGIDARHFRSKRGAPSGVALILVGGKERQNMIAVAKSANDLLSPRDVRAAASAFRAPGAVLAQLEVPLAAVEEAARLARRRGLLFILNPAPARALPRALLARVDVLTPNEREAEWLTGERRPERAAAALRKMGCRAVALTLGARGALIAEGGGARRVPAPRVTPVDTVGAGDCFNGWLAARMAEGRSLGEAARQAVAAAALSVTRRGAQASMPQRREVG